MSWITITNTNWEYSDTPELDDPYNSHIYAKMNNLSSGIRTNSNGTKNYVFCRRTDRTKGNSFGEKKA